MNPEQVRFQKYARYNRLANQAISELLAKLDPAALTVARGSWFGSIRGILDHLLTCDINLLRRFRLVDAASPILKHPRLDPPGAAWTVYDFGDWPGFLAERQLVDGLISDWTAACDPALYGKPVEYADSQGTPRRYALRDLADHLFNHQAHHRGQISQILDELGVAHDYSGILDATAIPDKG